MPMHIRCPNGHLLAIGKEHLGQKIRCPECKTVMVAEAPPVTELSDADMLPEPGEALAYAELEVEPQRVVKAVSRRPRVSEIREVPDRGDDAPRPRPDRGMKKTTRLWLARWGLALHVLKVVLLVLAVVIGLLSPLMLLIKGKFGPIGYTIVHVIAEILDVLWPITGTVGSFLCLWVPEKTGSRAIIVLSFLADAIAIVLRFVALVLLLTGAITTALAASESGSAPTTSYGGAAVLLELCGAFLGFCAWVLFMLFLRQVAAYFRDDNTSTEALTVLASVFALMVVSPMVFCCGLCGVAGLIKDAGPIIVAIPLVLTLLLFLVSAGIIVMRMLMVILNVRQHLSD